MSMSAEQHVINPILVQAYDADATVVQDAQAISARSTLWGQMHERITGQIEAGPSEARYFTPARPDTINKLSDSRRHDVVIGYELARALGSNAVPYYLSETALAVPRYGNNYLLSVTDASHSERNTLLRTEEGLTDLATDIAEQVAQRALRLRVNDGKTYAAIPGHKSDVSIAGWWTFYPDGSKRLLPDIPSCEMFMAATTLDQAHHGDTVVRIVPYGMEDREVATHRILRLLGRTVNAYSIITAPSGDIKKIRRWGDIGHTTPEVQHLYESMRVDGLAARTANLLSKQAHDKYKLANQHLNTTYSPNRQRGLTEALDALCSEPYESLKLYERFNPKKSEDILSPLMQLYAHLEEHSSRTAPGLLSIQHTPGKNTNSIIDSHVSLATMFDTHKRPIQLTMRAIFSRATDNDVRTVNNLFSSTPSLETIVTWLANNEKLHYLLLEGEKYHE